MTATHCQGKIGPSIACIVGEFKKKVWFWTSICSIHSRRLSAWTRVAICVACKCCGGGARLVRLHHRVVSPVSFASLLGLPLSPQICTQRQDSDCKCVYQLAHICVSVPVQNAATSIKTKVMRINENQRNINEVRSQIEKVSRILCSGKWVAVSINLQTLTTWMTDDWFDCVIMLA